MLTLRRLSRLGVYMIRKLTISLLCLAPLSAFAALAPFYQSRNEIKSVMSHPQVVEQLEIQGITKIEKISSGYKISTDKCELEVQVKYLPQDRPGPRQYALEVGQAVCSQN